MSHKKKPSALLFKQLDDVLETDDNDNKTAELLHRYSMNAPKSQHCFSLTECGVRVDLWIDLHTSKTCWVKKINQIFKSIFFSPFVVPILIETHLLISRNHTDVTLNYNKTETTTLLQNNCSQRRACLWSGK